MSSDYRIAGYLLPSILVLWLVACFVGAEHRVQAGAADASTSLAFDIPPYTGQSYTDSVPATLDLAEMARLSLNALTQPVDPDQDYSLYFVATSNDASWNAVISAIPKAGSCAGTAPRRAYLRGSCSDTCATII